MARSMSTRSTLAFHVYLAVEGWQLPTSKTAETELVDLVDLVGELAVVLDYIDVVGAGQQAGKGRVAGIPERR
jgi:hypothetical protein